MQKGGKQAIPVRCNGDAFPKNVQPLNPYMKTVAAMLPTIGAFRLAGYFTWNEEAVPLEAGSPIQLDLFV